MVSQVSDAMLAESAAHCIPEEPPRCPSATPSLTFSDLTDEDGEEIAKPETAPRRRRASTRLVAQNPAQVQRLTGESAADIVKRCCGGGCCLSSSPARREDLEYETVQLPDNSAFRSLQLRVHEIPVILSNVADLPEQTVFMEPLGTRSLIPSPADSQVTLVSEPTTELEKLIEGTTLDAVDTSIQPPSFVQPHPPYHVHPARIRDARELTKPGAQKRTYHFDLDVTTYPAESGVDFRVGGAIGVTAPNDTSAVDEILDLLLVPRFLRDKPVLLRTTKGRWPTVWGDDKPRELVTTRRDIVTWCSDIQSYPPKKPLLRVLAEHATDENERKILMYLCSGEGQGSFCDLRTGPHMSLAQLLNAFPSAKPPMELLLSVLQPLMPRFYSLSNDPIESYSVRDGTQRRLLEIAVSVHETVDWRLGTRTGTASGFFERQAKAFIEAKARGESPQLYVAMFKGLMANPLAKQFQSDGPMILIGAGVGIAPFRGFVQHRLKNANCANKVWVLQGIRDSLVDELYSGEWGVHESEVKKVVESRRGEGRYVQEEVRNQADLVWYVINSIDGHVFVCGSTKGMGEGVEEALVEVVMHKGNIGLEEAKEYWELKKDAGQYVCETW